MIAFRVAHKRPNKGVRARGKLTLAIFVRREYTISR
jgi:hypothetical protein